MTVVELFAGAGGASLGLLAAGFEEVRAVEWNADACETRRAAGLRCDEGDVRDPAHYAGVTADAVWSSFPCQAWSTAGKRLGKDDPRNGWPWTVDVLDQVRPAWFMGENVPGLTFHRGECNGRCADDCARLYFEETILRDLRQRFTWVGWSILDAARFGVPQNRERLFIVAGPRPIVWPVETHAPPEELRQGGLFGERRRAWVTVREALSLSLSLIGQRTPETAKGNNLWRSPDQPAVTIPAQADCVSARVVGIATAHEPGVRINDRERVDLMDRPAWTVAADVGRNRGGAMQVVEGAGRGAIPQSRRPMRLDTPADTIQASGEGPRPPCIPTEEPVGHWFPSADLPALDEDVDAVAVQRITRAASRPELLDRPSPTVTAVGECKGSGDGGNPDKLQRASDALWLGAGIRRLTPAECAKLMAFPDDHPWRGTKTSIYAQIGNGCCPPVVEALARAVRSA